MKHSLFINTLYKLVCYCCLVSLAGLANADKQIAQNEDANASKPINTQKTRRTPAITQRVYKKLEGYFKLVEDKKENDAFSYLLELEKLDNLNSYERALILNNLANTYYQIKNYRISIEKFEALIKEDDNPLALELNARFNIAQLYSQLDKPELVIEKIALWRQAGGSPTSTKALLLSSTAYYRLKDFTKSILEINQAIKIEKSQKRQIKKNWYQMKIASHFELKQIPQVISTLKEVLPIYPKKNYWMQLAAAYGEIEDRKNQLATLESIYRHNLFTKEAEYISLASLYLNADLPYKAGQTLAAGFRLGHINSDKIQPLRLLAQSWQLAKEFEQARMILEKAAQLTNKGEFDYRLAQNYFEDEQWEKAILSADAAIKKGDLKRIDLAYILLGIANFNLRKFDQAKVAFNLAAKEALSQKSANQWLQYISAEEKRLSIIEKL